MPCVTIEPLLRGEIHKLQLGFIEPDTAVFVVRTSYEVGKHYYHDARFCVSWLSSLKLAYCMAEILVRSSGS